MSEPSPESPPSPEPAPAPSRWRARLRKLLRVSVYTGGVLLLFLAFLPTGMRLGAEHWLNKQPGIEAKIGNIDLNIFSATFTLEDLTIEYQGMPHTRIERLAVAAKYLPLWDKHARIDFVELQGVRLVLEQFETNPAEGSHALRIGGLTLPRSEPAQQDREARDTQNSTPAWGFGWNRIAIDNAEIVWRQPEWSADLIIEHAHLNDVASWKPDSDSELHLQLRLNDAPMSITAQTRPFADQRSARGHIKMDDFDLGKLAPILAPAGIHDITGTFSCDLEHEVSFAPPGDIGLDWDGTLTLKQGVLSTAQVHVADAGLHWEGEGRISTTADSATRIRIDSTLGVPVLDAEALESGMALQQQGLRWDGSIVTTLKQGHDPDLEVKGRIATASVNVVDRARARLLASWAGLEGSGFTFAGDQLHLKQLNIKELVALHPSTNPTETEPPLVRCGTIALTDLGVDLKQEDGGTNISLNSLTLEDLGVEVIRFASGHTNIAQWSTPPPDTSAEPDTPLTSEDVKASTSSSKKGDGSPPPLRWRLDKLRIGGSSFVHFTDAAAEPEVNLELNALDLRVDNLDSAAPDTRNPLKFDAKLGRFATLKAGGSVNVLASEQEGNLELKLHGFQLYSIAAYVEETIGARIERGELDLVADVSIEESILELESQADLRSFTLGNITPEQEERISSNLGMPLSLALALLRDNNGDIHLNIPVSGDLSSPDIAIAPVVRKALFGAVQETVKLALKPLGIISGAGKLLGIGRELQLQPVVFNPGESSLIDPAATLKPLRELLAQRPQLRVILSAHLSEADLAALRPTPEDSKANHGEKTSIENQEEKQAEEPDMSEDEFRAAATALLQERLHTVKDWLIANDEVHNNQVLLTQPLLAPVPGEPRVEMRF